MWHADDGDPIGELAGNKALPRYQVRHIDKQYQGNGYGVKAMRLFIKKYTHVFYMAEEDNVASQKVATRAGMIVCGECFLSEQGEITASNHNFEDKRFIMYRTEH